jgi:hypothetical protein
MQETLIKRELKEKGREIVLLPKCPDDEQLLELDILRLHPAAESEKYWRLT